MVYAISNEPAGPLDKMREQNMLGDRFVFLSDPEGKVASLYAGKLATGVLNPATLVIGKSGKIVFAEAEEDYTKRPPTDKVLKAIKS